MDAVQLRERCNIGCRVEARKVDPTPTARDGRTNGIGIDSRLVQRLENESSIAHFGQRDRDARHLATLYQRVPARVQNLPTRGRHRAREEVLPSCARNPVLTFDDLDLRCSGNECEREKDQEGVNDRDALTGLHLAVRGSITTWLSVGMCMPSRCSTVAPSVCLAEASRISLSRRARSPSSPMRLASSAASRSDWLIPIVRRHTIASATSTKTPSTRPTRVRPRNATRLFAMLVIWRCASGDSRRSRLDSPRVHVWSRPHQALCRGRCTEAASVGKYNRDSIRGWYA